MKQLCLDVLSGLTVNFVFLREIMNCRFLIDREDRFSWFLGLFQLLFLFRSTVKCVFYDYFCINLLLNVLLL